MTSSRLRKELVAAPDSTALVVCYQRSSDLQDDDEGEQIGHAFAAAWAYDGGKRLPIYGQFLSPICAYKDELAG